MTFRFAPALVAVAMLVAPSTIAQDKEKQQEKPNPKTAYLDAESAGPDFAVQGEYRGTLVIDGNDVPYGVQVIADGDGKFRWVGYAGGLPGDGWDGKDVLRGDGMTSGSSTVMKGDHGVGTARDGRLEIENLDGGKLGTLEHVIRESPTAGEKPPEGAIVLFAGSSADAFKNGRIDDNGLLMQGITSKQLFGSFRLHLEFQLSFMPYGRGQGRSNSGCYMQGRYETQILDSFGLTGEHNECGGIYEIKKPDVNMCFPPLSWQTYDVEYHAAKYDDQGEKTTNARMTVRHNGVVIHDDVEVPRATRAAPVKESPEKGPIYIQDHGDPVRFRNIWLQPLDD